jgi:hypothetical protein
MGNPEREKRAFLVLHDYGMGGLWLYMTARSAEEITGRYPALVIVDEAPAWLTADLRERLPHYDIDEAPSGFLALVAEKKS